MPLFSHQEEGVDFLIERERVLLADDAGLGKSLQAIKAIERIGQRALIFAPKSTIRQWERYIRDWTELKIAIPNGQKRSHTYGRTQANIIILNYEKAWRQIEQEQLPLLDYGIIVLDEAQRIKNWKAKQTRAIKDLPSPQYKFALTATPLENRTSELISILDFLDLWPKGRRYTGGYDDQDLLLDILYDHMLRRVFDDAEYMPPATMTNYYVELSDYQKELYSRFLNELVVYIEDREFNVMHALAKLTRLRQICNSTELLHKKNGKSNKLRELIILIDEYKENGKKTVVFTEFKQMAYIIKKRLEKLGLKAAFIRGDRKCDVEKEKEKFRQDHDVMLCTKSGEEGLNLQVAHEIINFELPYNPARVLQRIGRCRRIGQTKTVNVINLLGLGTIDERILEIIYEKSKIFEETIEPHNRGIKMDRNLIREIVGGQADVS